MIKRLLLLVILSVVLKFYETSSAWATAPVATSLKVAPQTQLRFFYDLGEWSPFGQLILGSTHLERVQKSAMVGTYYWLHPNLRAGLFVKFDQGNQQDTDWIKTTERGWHWSDATHRTETSLVFDLSPRIKWGEQVLLEAKSRLSWNATQSLWTESIRPGIVYFSSALDPSYSFYAQTEVCFALDMRKAVIPETALYLGAMLHFLGNASRLAVGPYMSLWNQTWGSTQAFEQVRQSSYQITERTLSLGLAATLSLK